MSDVKQQILDEIKGECWAPYREDAKEDAAVYLREVNEIINRRLEGMAIVPVVPTEAMIDIGNDMDEAGGESESIYHVMLESFKESNNA